MQVKVFDESHEKDLENSGFKTQVKIIELCFKTLKKADFEANLERIKKHGLINY